MKSIKQAAQDYESQVADTIDVLPEVSVDVPIKEETFQDKDGKDFTVNLATVEKKHYRVPYTVLKQLKANLKVNPKLKMFTVQKEGQGLNTSYTVIALR